MSTSIRPHRPRIAITMGDPCGVGPEIIVSCLQSRDLFEQCLPVVIGDPNALRRAVEQLGADLKLYPTRDPRSLEHWDRPGGIAVLHV